MSSLPSLPPIPATPAPAAPATMQTSTDVAVTTATQADASSTPAAVPVTPTQADTSSTPAAAPVTPTQADTSSTPATAPVTPTQADTSSTPATPATDAAADTTTTPASPAADTTVVVEVPVPLAVAVPVPVPVLVPTIIPSPDKPTILQEIKAIATKVETEIVESIVPHVKLGTKLKDVAQKRRERWIVALQSAISATLAFYEKQILDAAESGCDQLGLSCTLAKHALSPCTRNLNSDKNIQQSVVTDYFAAKEDVQLTLLGDDPVENPDGSVVYQLIIALQ